VVLITHEVTIAKAAQRTISLQDGRILTDSRSRLGARAPRASARKPAS
jgi:ABC-type lipoprotein export system ATPase subunit